MRTSGAVVWTPWRGGDRPVDAAALVHVRIRGYREQRGLAGDFCWDAPRQPGVIVAWRVARVDEGLGCQAAPMAARIA